MPGATQHGAEDLFLKGKLNYAGELGSSSRSLSLLKAYAFNLVKLAWPFCSHACMEQLRDQVTYITGKKYRKAGRHFCP